MGRDFTAALLFAVILPGCVQDQTPASAVQPPDSRTAQQAQPAGCNDLAPLPGQGKEYNLFRNMTGARSGCAEAAPAAYQKSDGQPAPSQQEALDRAACKSEGARAASVARGLQPGEYDIFKNAASAPDAGKAEQDCMAQRGYRSVAN